MKKKSLSSFFEEYLARESLFIDRNVLLPSYTPENISHRDKEVKQIASILAPVLKQEKPSNIFIYGNTGTGKTLTIKHIINNINLIASDRNIQLKTIYSNCKLKKVADTEYRLIAHLSSFFGRSIPPTGLPTDEVYKIFYDSVEKEKSTLLLVLDEIDQLITKTGDDILYNLTRINEDLKHSQISIIGISNDTTFMENIDTRVKSSLSEEDVFFSPYNALEIQNILKERASKAFKENTVEPGVIEKCAAYAAREHGDARKAIELLRVSGEIAERNKNKTISLDHIDEAEEKLEKEKIFDVVKTQPKQFQAVLFSIISIKTNSLAAYTGEIYDFYKKLCFKIGLRPLTQRRVSDIIREFELMGIINTKTISKGRYGRTRDISLSVSSSVIPLTKKILEDELILN
ncbi:cell division control protein Cdc6 [Candidatus Woesearchaeota archaeon]|nr:cell division control protein Cdc6 [Candidatus Woesearchaeota archaeon]|tara:strand:+ start:2666 stop:3874 length:1209 start_codon:yes stop_codon:yes gene_type:complete